MKKAAWLRENGQETPRAQHGTYRSAVKFFRRYPIFLLVFGPPIFRSQAIDATSGVIDFWSVFQVGWLSLIAFRAIFRLTSARFIAIPKQIRSILRLAFFLGLIFLISATYSPSPVVSVAYAVLYFLTLICVIEFVVDTYQTPPNWTLCLFQLRLSALVLVIMVLLVIPMKLTGVVIFLGRSGIRLVGGTVAPMPVICPMIAIISVYTFLHSLEPRVRAAFFSLLA
jgi:hypothetical protein